MATSLLEVRVKVDPEYAWTAHVTVSVINSDCSTCALCLLL